MTPLGKPPLEAPRHRCPELPDMIEALPCAAIPGQDICHNIANEP